MSTLAAGQILAKYSQNPAGIEAVRAVTDLVQCPVEFVLLDAERAIVMAAVGPTALQPRSILDVERDVLAGTDLAEANGRTAVRVDLEDGWIGALSFRGEVSGTSQKHLIEHAAQLAEELTVAPANADIDASVAKRILTGLRDTVVVLSPSFEVSWANAAVMSLLGMTPEEIIGQSAESLVHPQDIGRTLEAAAKLNGANRVYRIHIRMRDALGGWVPVSISGVDHSHDPDINGLVLSIRNDERESETERTLAETRRVSSTILQSLTDAVVGTNERGHISIVNTSARSLFSIPADAALSSLTSFDFRLLDENGNRVRPADHPLTSEEAWTDSEMQIATPAGIRHVSVSRSQVSSELDHLGTVVTFHDITQARSDARELRTRALHDQLTGLANRRCLQERLHALEASGEQPRLAALFVDIDKFKNVNDIHGHNAGDAVLRATARRLGNQIREIDILARPGGDEFLVILVNPESETTAVEVAERMRAALARPFDVNGVRLHLTASVGVAMYDDPEFDDERIMQHADIALYAAKERGRDRVEVFDETLATIVESEQRQRELVRDALDNDRLVMHFQPIVDQHGQAVGVEALARCMDTAGRIVEPAEFMEAIDGTKLMVRLDQEGFAQTCKLAATLAQDPATRGLYVSANFSAMTIAQSGFYDMITTTIKRYGAPAHALCIEVTETAAFEAGKQSIDALTALNRQGIRLVLDDFGTGYSSLSHLRDLPLSSVKIDRTFTVALTQPGAERAIASAVKDLAWSLGFSVVAEGVETAEHRDAVCQIGVSTMQGWYFARAVQADELLKALQTQPNFDLRPPRASVGQ